MMLSPPVVSAALEPTGRVPARVISYAVSNGKLTIRRSVLRRQGSKLVVGPGVDVRVDGKALFLRGRVTRVFPSQDRRWSVVWVVGGGEGDSTVIVDLRANRVVTALPGSPGPHRFLHRSDRLLFGIRPTPGEAQGLNVDLRSGESKPIAPFDFALEDPDTGCVAFINRSEGGLVTPRWQSPAAGIPEKPSPWASSSLDAILQGSLKNGNSLSDTYLVRRKGPRWIGFFERTVDSVDGGTVVWRSTSETGGPLYTREGDGQFLLLDRACSGDKSWFVGTESAIFGLGRLAEGRYLYRWNQINGAVDAIHLVGIAKEDIWHFE
jgi:hypothetical protein